MERHVDDRTSPPPARHVVVVTGGVAPMDLAGVPDLVIAADSGADTAYQLGLRPDLVVGDLDSVSAATLERLDADDVEIERHPADKDAGDLELALDAALLRGATSIAVLGGDRGRLDHLLVNAGVVASPRYRTVDLTWHTVDAHIHVIHGPGARSLSGTPGDVVTLIPGGGPARAITTSGLHWALRGEQLEAGSSRGLSNLLDAPTATVEVAEGTLLIVHIPRPPGPPAGTDRTNAHDRRAPT